MFNKINRYRELIIVIFTLIVGGYSYETTDNVNEKGSEALNTIRMVSILFRHGERNPDSSYPTDPNINYTWPGGFGALVPKGALNLLNVGKKLRARYSKLIPSNDYYQSNYMRVLSSEYERCLMSGESFLAGFMPPKNSLNTLPISWQPIPLYSTPRSSDYYVFQFASCPVYDQMLGSLGSPDSEFYNETVRPYVDVLKLLSNYTGTTFASLLQVENFLITLQIQQSVGLKIPEWTKYFYPELLIEMVKVSSRVITQTEWMKKMKAGPLLTQMLDNMNGKKLKTLNPDRSLFIYSGHDISIKTLLNTIGIMSQTGEIPGFGATLALELHENKLFKNDDLEIRIVYYQNGYQKIPMDVNIPNCEKPCPLSKFTVLMEPYINRNVVEICQNK